MVIDEISMCYSGLLGAINSRVQQILNNPDEPFGAPAYGVFPNAQLSYGAMGLTDGDFEQVTYFRIDGQLNAALNACEFVVVYGMTFDDGGPDGKGVHEIHFNAGKTNEDGAILIYSIDPTTNKPKRTWFFFKFGDDRLEKAG